MDSQIPVSSTPVEKAAGACVSEMNSGARNLGPPSFLDEEGAIYAVASCLLSLSAETSGENVQIELSFPSITRRRLYLGDSCCAQLFPRVGD